MKLLKKETKMFNLKLLNKNILKIKPYQHVFYYWLREESKGIAYENSSHKLKDKIYGRRERQRYERWKESLAIDFKQTIYTLVYNNDYHEFYIIPLIGEYIVQNKFKTPKGYFDTNKDYSYYNFIGYFYDEDEAKKEKEILEEKLNNEPHFKAWKEKLKELNLCREQYAYDKEALIAKYDYLEAKEKHEWLSTHKNKNGFDDIKNNIQSEFNKEFRVIKRSIEKNESELNNERRVLRQEFKEKGEEYFKTIKINSPKDLNENL